MAKYKIFPPIGFGRVGGSSTGFIVAREQIGQREIEIDSMGNESPVVDYKSDAGHLKPVAARFRIFEVPDGGGSPVPIPMDSVTKIEWTVEVANRKNGVARANDPPGEDNLPVNTGTGGSRRITPGPLHISGTSSGPVGLDGGTFDGLAVSLGQLRTDKNQNLLVVGAQGVSRSSTGASIPSFYNNPTWHDDSCDGIVRARIVFADGTASSDVDSAWVVIGPPDFAPDIEGLVTLYDIAREASGIPLGDVKFTRDIFPIIHRAHNLKWVNTNFDWSTISTDWAKLSDPGPAHAALRSNTRDQITVGALSLNEFDLTNIQVQILDAFASGNFSPDWIGEPVSAGIQADELTRCALDSTVGQGFFPGIEAGKVTQNSAIYKVPFEFRLDEHVVGPGDLTALMAVPWQADFFACGHGWWPSQRPNEVLDDPNGSVREWSRGVFSRIDLVGKFNRLGVIQPQQNAAGEIVFAERERDNTLP